MEGYTPSATTPRPTHVGVGLGLDPLPQGRLPNGEQLVASVVPLLAHDGHAGLVGDADVSLASAAAAGDGLYALDFVADGVVIDGVGQEDQSVRAGVRVVILFDFGRAEYARLFAVHSL
jgi:hypothetical protein